MTGWQNFLKSIQMEGRAFLFFTVLLTLFRIIFIGVFSQQLMPLEFENIAETLWLGFRLSLKTTGGIILVAVVIAAMPQQLWRRWPADKIRCCWYGGMIGVLTFLFAGRLPFYRVFNSGYNMMLINGKNDDIRAIIDTAVKGYHVIFFLVGAVVMTMILIYVLYRFLKRPAAYMPAPKGRYSEALTAVGGIALFTILFIFIRFGGALSYTHSINWENAARLNSNLLNEAVLDDVQALYRVRSISKRIRQLSLISLTAEELRRRIAAVGGNGKADNFDDAFFRTITNERLAEQPESVTVILGESYGLWPFLKEYDEPGVYLAAAGCRFASASESMGPAFALAQGTGTMPAINGLLTGMPDVGIYPNYESESYKAPYGLGIGQVMKNLGYKTVFWYGGFGLWQNVKAFALHQGFDEFHDASEIASSEENAWGVADKDLFAAIETYMTTNKDEKIFNLIMTTSNHPPYSIPVEEEGFDPSGVHGHLPDSIADTPAQINEMGHFWYADHVMGEFVDRLQKEEPTSLFVITGDHSERFSFAHDVGPYVASTIPLIFYGKGIHKGWLQSKRFAMSIQMIPTLAELVGRQGQTYRAMIPSLFETEPFVFNHCLWADDTGIFRQNDKMPESYRQQMDQLRELAAWRIRHGSQI